MGDIWAKMGGAVKKGAETTKDVLLLVPKALIYPIKKLFASWGEMKHDAKISLKKAVGMDVPEEEKEYYPPIETTEASKNLGIKIICHKDGKIKFLASKTLTGDIPYLTPEQLGKIEELNKKNKYSSIAIFKEENKVVIEVDVEKITEKIKNASEHKGKSQEKIKELIIEQIKQKVDDDLKELAKITGRGFKVHTDRKLLYSIAEKLYREYDGQDKSAEEFNMTNPSQFPFSFGKETIFPTKIQLSQDIKKGLEGAFNFKDISSGKPDNPLSTPTVENKETGKGGRSI
ncbi:hypothetical protein [Wolbachia endosymbiont of Tettigetta isshikii]|uniref:hypothetical protein n=1 Tax=Wolbachia endosymbiont of Tettigetta isshikii TaxID=3239093 RepID=UPI00397F197A